MKPSGHLGSVVSMSAGHFGSTINGLNQPIFIPCSVCQQGGKQVEAYWLNEETGSRLCDEHSQGYLKISHPVTKFCCDSFPDSLPDWVKEEMRIGELIYFTVDTGNRDLVETLEGEFDPPVSLPDLLDSYGFTSVHIIEEG